MSHAGILEEFIATNTNYKTYTTSNFTYFVLLKNRQTEEEVGRQYQRLDRNGLCQLNQSSRKQGNIEVYCCEFICGAPTTFQGYGIEYNRIVHLAVACGIFYGVFCAGPFPAGCLGWDLGLY